MARPSTHEQLAAAAHRILTDNRRHADQARLWALRLLRSERNRIHTNQFLLQCEMPRYPWNEWLEL